MATKVDLTFVEGSAETVAFTVTSTGAGDDLTTVASLRFVLKADGCVDDADAELVLTTANPTEMQILTQTATEITGEVYVPPLAEPYRRLYHIDAVAGAGTSRTALYGRVTFINL